MVEDGTLLGQVVELDVGAPAHGGSCVARHDGRVVFVRHALPGERVRARVTEDRGASFCRADAVEILQPGAERVAPQCPHAGPGRCGGCDWQHASASAQRALKLAVIREQFARVAGIDVAGLLGEVEPLDGGLLGWRTRITYAVEGDGRPGLHRYRSHEIEPVELCPLGAASVGDSTVLQREWPGLSGVEVVRDGAGDVAVLAHRPGPGRQARGRRPPDRVQGVSGPDVLSFRSGGREFAVSAGGFWQVHPAALATFASALLRAVAPQAGESVLDLYAGAGPLTAAFAEAVGPTGQVLGLESARAAVADAGRNLADLPWAEVRHARVTSAALDGLGREFDVVLLDPPRAGAGRETTARLLALHPRAVGYLACEPASLARDVAVAAGLGWRLTVLRAFDAFPMTHHVECVALLEPGEL
ncbi:MAG: class I SAM-dependent RNA methyltransferase [Jatrophihabitantaceae bacterium]